MPQRYKPLSFSGLTQLGTAVWLAVYRPGLPPRAIIAGILAGLAVWGYVLFLPLIVRAAGLPDGWMTAGPLGVSLLSPDALFALGALDPLARAVGTSLVVNALVIFGVARFGHGRRFDEGRSDPLSPEVLRDLARRFLSADRIEMLFASDRDAQNLAVAIEHELAAVVGSASARLLMDAARRRTPAPLDTVADLLRHNAHAGLMGAGDIERKIQRRLAHKRAGRPHHVERDWPDGRIIEIRGNPMPGGGFVATFTDVTALRRAENELREINETLEQRVLARTAELEQAKVDAERASEAKTRFLAAVSHDLVQPLNAAQLLTHALSGRVEETDTRRSLTQISGELAATEDLLEGLLDISRLDAGGMDPRPSEFPLGELFDQLHGEFSVLASERGLTLDCMRPSVWVRTDPQLLRRILQNFLSNAIRYTERGRVLIGCRRRSDTILIGVWDTGPGIPDEFRPVIFEEFRRLDEDHHAPGLGLGLAIAERMARLLDHELTLDSREGRGTLFGVRVPRATARNDRPRRGDGEQPRQQARVLVVDNDPAMLSSLEQLLGGWGMDVITATDAAGARAAVGNDPPSLAVLDYHLDHGLTGIDLLEELRALIPDLPAVLISADHADALTRAAARAGCELLHKPLRPLALRSLIGRQLRRGR